MQIKLLNYVTKTVVRIIVVCECVWQGPSKQGDHLERAYHTLQNPPGKSHVLAHHRVMPVA